MTDHIDIYQTSREEWEARVAKVERERDELKRDISDLVMVARRNLPKPHPTVERIALKHETKTP